MSPGPEWFAAKRYGYGAGLPIAWQGWALLSGYMAILGLAVWLLSAAPIALSAAVISATFILLLITARTTRGGWRWRWGKCRTDR
jgi:hypothetical protein